MESKVLVNRKIITSTRSLASSSPYNHSPVIQKLKAEPNNLTLNLNPYYDAYEAFSRDIETSWNTTADRLKIDIKIGMGDFSKPAPNLEKRIVPKCYGLTAQQIIEQVFKEINGVMIYDNKNEDIISLVNLLETTQKNILLVAETQYGKTYILIFVAVLRALCNFKSERRELVGLINPTKNAGARQTKNDFDNMFNFHPSLHLEGQRRTASHVHSSETLKVYKRTCKSTVLQIIADAAVINATDVLLIIDEADEASARKSVIAHWIEQLELAGFKVRILACTATPYPIRNNSTFVPYTPLITEDSGYCGNLFGKRIPIASYSRLAKLLRKNGFKKAESFAKFSLRKYKSDVVLASFKPVRTPEDTDDTFKEKSNRHISAQRRARTTAEMLAEVIVKHCVGGMIASPENGFLGLPFNGGRGGFVRIGNNLEVAHFIKHAKPIFKRAGIELIEYFGKSMKEGTKSLTFMEKLASKPYHYMVVVKDSARRADRLPKHCTMIYDFTERFSTVTAKEQGALARVTGYDKITDTCSPIVTLSDENYRIVSQFRKDFDDSGYRCPRQSPGSHSVIESSFLAKNIPFDNGRGHGNQRRFDFAKEPTLSELKEKMDAIFGQFIGRTAPAVNVNGKTKQSKTIQKNINIQNPLWVASTTSDRSGKADFDIYSILIDHIPELEKICASNGENVSILVPGKIRRDGASYTRDPVTGFWQVAFRGSEDKGGVQDRANVPDRSRLRLICCHNTNTIIGFTVLLSETPNRYLIEHLGNPVTVIAGPDSMYYEQND